MRLVKIYEYQFLKVCIYIIYWLAEIFGLRQTNDSSNFVIYHLSLLIPKDSSLSNHLGINRIRLHRNIQ